MQMIVGTQLKLTGGRYQVEMKNGNKCNQQHLMVISRDFYKNSFLGSVATLISGARIKQFKSFFQNEQNIKQCYKLQLHQAFPQTKNKYVFTPQRNRAYIIGADASTGTDSDYQAMTVWDVTNTFNIQLVASFYENNVSPKVFAYILAKTASLYNKAFIACENNVSHTTIDYLWKQFEYENVIPLWRKSKNYNWYTFIRYIKI